MKTTVLVAMLAAVGTVGGAMGFMTQFNEEKNLSSLTLENLEALTDGEGAEIVCSGGSDGDCYAPDFGRMKMCGEYMYTPCIFSGVQSDSCTEPC